MDDIRNEELEEVTDAELADAPPADPAIEGTEGWDEKEV
jgi:hypothetical protein